MNEYIIGHTFCGGLVGLALATIFYMRGGRYNKAQRRFIAPAVVMGTVVIQSLILGVFHWALLAIYVFKMLEYIQGYSNKHGMGWLKRIGIALTSIACGVFLCAVVGANWYLLILHVPLSLATVLFAFKNPLPAAAEEPLICMMNNLIIPAYVFSLM